MNPENAPDPFTCEVCGEDRYRDRPCDGCAGRIVNADGSPDLDDPEQRERWRVDGDKTATWALGKLKAARDEAERLRANARELIESIEFQLGLDLKGPADDARFFEGCLIDYRRRLEDENPNLAKTYKLPLGALKRRAGRVSTVVEAPEVLAEWLIEHGHRHDVKMTPSVSAVKAAFPNLADPESGECLPGIRAVLGDDSLSVETY